MKHLLAICLAAGVMWIAGSATGMDKSDDEAYATFENGRAAYERGAYRAAVDSFEQACEKAIVPVGTYYIWLGAAAERAYEAIPDTAKADSLYLLKKGIDAYREALARNRDPGIRYDMGRLMATYGMDGGRAILDREIVRTLKPPPSEGAGPEAKPAETLNAARRQQAITDTLRALWGISADGLGEIWEALLAQERKEQLQGSAPGKPSETLLAYLSVYIETSLNLVEAASRSNFEGIHPDYYIPVILSACRRGQAGAKADWFARIQEAVRFDDGANMRCAIYRLKGLRLSQEKKNEQAIETLQKALAYARADTSKASLALDMAFAAYQMNLEEAVGYARQAYGWNPEDQRIRDTYGGLALSLASTRMEKGANRKAIATLYPVTAFKWKDRAEALMTLARAYLNSNVEGALDRAYVAAEEAYRLNGDRYREPFLHIAQLHGSLLQAADLQESQ